MITENCSWEVLEAVTDLLDNTEESKELVASICRYLYDTNTDDKMKDGCVEILNDINYCLSCGSKMIYYEWNETRPIGVETMSGYFCPICDMEEMERLR